MWQLYIEKEREKTNKLLIALSTSTGMTQKELLNMRYMDFLELQCAYQSLAKDRELQASKHKR